MIIKKFQGRTKEEALESAKKELGEGIVEMNVKTVKAKGLLGIFKGTKVEVTVAKEEENERYGFAAAAAESAAATATPAANSINVAVGQGKIIPMKQPKEAELELADAPVLQEARAMGQTVAEVLAAFPPEAKKQAQPKPMNKASAKEKTIAEELSENPLTEVPTGNVLEKKLDTLQSLLEKQLSQQEEKAAAEQQKEEEKQKAEEEQTRMNFLRLLYNKMIDNEVHEKYANEIIDEIEKNCKPDVTLDFMLSEIYQRMILKLGKAHVIEPAENGPKVIFFVGPTGVGKTTTIAKIASTFRIEQKKKVALLTADTYRIAAAEQLRTYANILEVPFRVVYSAQEITSAISDFKDYDYIIVDTTGHSPNNEAQRESMSELITSVETQAPKEIFLVLSASTKYRDLMKIADTYKELVDYKLIFTKLDETSTLGNIYNLKLYTGAALSYVTCGQNVPDDIEYFNPQATVKQLLGGKR
ncbi:MAG: flagellar biosynthesis protein FlhF [Lachnospiraceae bacterium]|nr:flagellar biosynthesis protein FlhF [Lachnospiraceae bacterium]